MKNVQVVVVCAVGDGLEW